MTSPSPIAPIPPPDIAAEKRRLRACALARRAAMGEAARTAAAQAAARHALAAMDLAATDLAATELGRLDTGSLNPDSSDTGGAMTSETRAAPGRVVALFASFRDEIDTTPLAQALRARGAALALPVIVARDAPLLFRRWDADDPLAPEGAFRIPTPRADAPALVPAIILVPLAAFDRRGFRVGYGGGFYDRTLAALRAQGALSTIGYAFACQEVETVPEEPHDEALDLMVTEQGAFPCPGS